MKSENSTNKQYAQRAADGAKLEATSNINKSKNARRTLRMYKLTGRTAAQILSIGTAQPFDKKTTVFCKA